MKKKGVLFILPAILVIIIFTVGFFTSSWYLNEKVKVRLENEFSKQTKGQYSLKIGSMNISLLAGSIGFTNVSVIPDSLPSNQAAYRIAAKRADFTGLNVLRFILRKRIIVNSIELQNPSLTVTQAEPGQDKEVKEATPFSLYNVIKVFANSLKVREIQIRNFDLKLYASKKDTVPSLYSNNNQLRVINLFVGPSTKKLPGLFETDSIALVLNKFSYVTSDSLYTFQVARMEVSYQDSLLLFDSVRVIPNYSKKAFADIAGKQTDRFNIFAGKLEFRSIDLRRFFEHHDLIAPALNISAFSMVAFRDKNDKREFKRPSSLQKLILTAPVYMRIDTIKLSKSIIAYEEVAPGKKVPGRITFNDISANFTGLTNDSLLISAGRKLIFNAECRLMDDAPLKATYIFPMDTRQMVFKCSGFLTGLSMSSLNGMLEPTTGVSLKQGKIDTLDFSFSAGENESVGRLKLIYNGLKVELPDNGNEKLKFKDKVMIFVANNFVLKDSNPSGKKEPRIARMHFERNKQRFMFHYTWQTIFSGIKETVGFPDIKPKK